MRREKDFLFLYGVRAVMEKIRGSPGDVVEVLVARGHRGSSLEPVEAEVRRLGLSVRHIESGDLDRLARGGRHQGIGVKVTPYRYATIEEIEENQSVADNDCILVLDGVNDPRNLGALLRTAEGMGVTKVVIPKHRSVGVTPAVVQTSSGAVFHLKVCRVTSLRRVITSLKKLGYWVIGLDPKAKEEAYGRLYAEKLVVVLGNEGAGIRPSIRKECDILVSIPMRGRVASLNVAVAGGIFLYEWRRQMAVSGGA